MIRSISGKIRKKVFTLSLLAASLTLGFIIVFFSVPATAGMALLPDEEMSNITATGFSRFTLTEGATDIARIDLNLSAATYTEVGAMQMGYHDNGAGPGWDQNWQSVSFGADAHDLVMKDFVFEAEFNNISDPANRQVQGITVGFTDVTGTIASDFGSFTGNIQGVNYQRAPLGQTSVTLANEPFLLKLEVNEGVSFQIGY